MEGNRSYLPAEFPIIVILGPTATGKTRISINLAKELHAEIVSFDSVQIFKKLDIGSAKPTKDEMQGIPHHLIDILDVDEHFDASLYAKRALSVIKSIKKRGKNVILVGGTGLYLRALTDGLIPCIPLNTKFRENLREIIQEKGGEYLHKTLMQTDPQSAMRIHPNDHYRIIRALEIFHLTGKTMSEWIKHQSQTPKISLNLFKIGLTLPREKLYKNIEKRVDSMIEKGLIDEVKGILKAGYSPQLKSLQTLGYKEIISYLQGEISLEQAIYLIKRNTRRYAKRQITWFKEEKNVKWFNADTLDFYPLWEYINRF